MCMTTRQHSRGFSLIEVIIFIVVVSVGLVGILQVSTTVVRSSADPMVRKQAIAVAESMLEEILLKEYCDPDTGDRAAVPPTCGAAQQEAARNLWDDVDDYNAFASVGVNDVNGAAVLGLGAYNVAVAVGAPAVVAGGGVVVLKMVTVTVSWAGGNVVLMGYRGNY